MDNLFQKEDLVAGERRASIYYRKEEKNPLVFLINDGYMFREIENNVLGKLESFKNLALVFLDSKNRNSDYTPWYGDSLVERIDCFPGKGDDYLEFLRTDVLGKLRSLGLNIGGDRTYLVGSSLGGLIGTYGIVNYQKTFAGGVLVSSSYWYDGFVDYLKKSDLDLSNHIIYMDMGAKEGISKITLGKDNLKLTKEVRDIFLEKGLKEENLEFKVHEGMKHKESYFVDRIYDGIEFIHRKKEG